jgi:HlyD family secretion protein
VCNVVFNQRTTPELTAEFARFGQNRVNAGMQAEVFVRTEDRSPLEYIVKPLKDQIAKAFRER